MDWLTFSSKVIDSIAWPAVTMVLGLVFRKKLLDLVPSIRKFKAGPLEAEFELAAKEVRVSAAETISQNRARIPEGGEQKRNTGPAEIFARMLNARNDPSGIILESWAKLDGELFRLGQQACDVVDPLTSTEKVYMAVMSSNLLPEDTSRLIRGLRALRNKVAHARVSPTSAAAQDYTLAVDQVIELIDNCRKNLPNYSPTIP
jgi:hypothetical protein